MRRDALIAGLFAGIGVAPACAQEAADDPSTYDLVGLDGATVGRVEFLQGARGLLVQVRAEGLAAGAHGLHVHETGICEAPFQSAGGHYDPDGRSHGLLSADGPHAGDLPNLVVGEDASLVIHEAWIPGLALATLQEGDGSAVVIHAGPDDYRTDPAGAAGDRVACAAIRTP